jgi:redox-sensitive bicupin YhaK (pirin superfamily)
MSQLTLFPASSRGFADHGWLKSAHTFSFASYHNPERIHFGVLRVINDDEVAPGMGFGTHPHDNMEIITIPLEGALAHQDSMGHKSIITTGEVQVMSAGSGITHSEFNASKEDWVKLFQIWIITKTKNVTPRYDQKKFDFSVKDHWIPIVQSIDTATEALGIHQDVQFCIGHLSQGTSLTYTKIASKNKVFVMVIDGSVDVEGQVLGLRDGIGISGSDEIGVSAKTDARVLVMDIP